MLVRKWTFKKSNADGPDVGNPETHQDPEMITGGEIRPQSSGMESIMIPCFSCKPFDSESGSEKVAFFLLVEKGKTLRWFNLVICYTNQSGLMVSKIQLDQLHSFRDLFLKGETTKGETQTDCRLKGETGETEPQNISRKFWHAAGAKIWGFVAL